MFRSLTAAALLFSISAHAESLDTLIDFSSLGADYHSLRNPGLAAQLEEGRKAQEADTATPIGLNSDRRRHVLRASRFMHLPSGMIAADVIRAWEAAGGHPNKAISPKLGPLFVTANDGSHQIADVYLATGYVCDPAGPEVWVSRYYFVTADARATLVAPPSCE